VVTAVAVVVIPSLGDGWEDEVNSMNFNLLEKQL